MARFNGFKLLWRGAAVAILTLLLATGSSTVGDHRDWQIRGGHNGDSTNLSMLEGMARNGMNSIFVSLGGHMLDSNHPEAVGKRFTLGPHQRAGLDRWQQATAEHGLKFFPMIELYGTDDRKRWPLERSFLDLSGKQYANTPCPNHAGFWDKKIIPFYLEVARWAKDKPNVPGILMDPEMYGADRSSFVDDCFCNHCRVDIARQLGTDAENLNLEDRQTLANYRNISAQIVEQHASRLRMAVHQIVPNCLLGGYILDHFGQGHDSSAFYKGTTMGWGTAELPVLIFSESTYETGYHAAYAKPDRPLLRGTGSGSVFGLGDHPGYVEHVKRAYKQWGAHAQLVLGIWINRVPDENFAENLYHMAKNTRGYWIYDLLPLGERSLRQEHSRMALPGGGQAAYWSVVRRANDELDKLQAQPNYESPLQVRPFSLPAPAVDLNSWVKIDLAHAGEPAQHMNFLTRRSEGHYYFPARAGDHVQLAVVIDSAHPTKKKRDAVGVVLLDPQGKVFRQEKLTYSDLGELPGPDGRWHGERQVSFDADQTGTYCVMLDGIRYAYGLSACSQPWVAAVSSQMHLYTPRTFFLRSQSGYETVTLVFGSPVQVEVSDAQGKKYPVSYHVASEDTHKLMITLPDSKPRTLAVAFQGTPNTLMLKSHAGIQSWLGSQLDAPFPGE